MSDDPLILSGGRGLILVERAILATARRFLSPPEHRLEAGGLLLGAYRGAHLDVVGLTTPLPADRRHALWFDRRDRGHGGAAREAWRRSGGTVTCVGEWHSHTAGSASPSTRDLTTWRQILRKARGRQHLFLIVSPQDTNFVEGVGDGGGNARFRTRLGPPSAG